MQQAQIQQAQMQQARARQAQMQQAQMQQAQMQQAQIQQAQMQQAQIQQTRARQAFPRLHRSSRPVKKRMKTSLERGETVDVVNKCEAMHNRRLLCLFCSSKQRVKTTPKGKWARRGEEMMGAPRANPKN